MKRQLLLSTAILGLLSLKTNAQTYWKADAGTNQGDIIWDYNLAVPATKLIQEINVSSESTPTVEGFLPKPPSGTVLVTTYPSTNPDINTKPAGFSLSGGPTPSLTMIATSGPSNAGPSVLAASSRFSAYGFANATRVMSLHFNMTLSVEPSNTDAGWYFVIGGNSYPGILTINSSNIVTSTATTSSGVYAHDNRIFGAYRLIKSSQNGVFVHTTMGVNSITAPGGRSWSGISGGPANLAANTSYKIDIFCNNSTGSQTYIMNDTEYPLEAGKYVIYVNGVLKATLDKLAVTTSQNLKSFMIMSRDAAKSEDVLDNSASLTISNFKVVHLGTVSTTPVTLTNFDGVKTNTGIALNWKTASEQNNSHFRLNRSANGLDFSYLTRVEGNGTTSNVNSYSYLDRNPAQGINYYQLEQVDNDGATTVIEKIVDVKYAVSDELFTVSKISSNQLKAVILSEKNENVEFYITDVTGKVIYKSKKVLSVGNNEFDVYLSGVKSGIYIATVKGLSQKQSVKIVL